MSSPFVACWAVKGGSGTTAVAAALAVSLAERWSGALLVDLAGDALRALGHPGGECHGVSDWLRAGAQVPPDGLARLEVPVAGGLQVLPRGEGSLRAGPRVDVLTGMLAGDSRPVVVDCGVLRPPATNQLHVVRDGHSAGVDAPVALAAAATRSLLVTRACYLSLARVAAQPLVPTGVVLVEEPGRALGADDVAHVVGRPVVATVKWDPAIARAIDSGVLCTRLPKALGRLVEVAA